MGLVDGLLALLAGEGGKKAMPAVHDVFTDDALRAIRNAVIEAEIHTSAQIRVMVKLHADPDLAGKENLAHEQAAREFLRHGMDRTKDRSGVLVLLLWNERRFAVIGDTGIYAKLNQDYWDRAAAKMAAHFAADGYVCGLTEVVDDVGAALAALFPRRPDTTDELPDDVIVENK